MIPKNIHPVKSLLVSIFIFGLMTQNAQAQNRNENVSKNASLYATLLQLNLKLAELQVLLESKARPLTIHDKNEVATWPALPEAKWELYVNEQSGFELKTPMYYFYDWLKDKKYQPQGTTGNSSGKNYIFTQLAGGQIYPSTYIDIVVIENLGDPLLQPYGILNQFWKIPTIHTSSLIINGVRWELFYNPKQTMVGCESSFAQTLMSNNDVLSISISADDTETQCPGTLETSDSQPLLKQILSTFKFSKTE